MKPKTGEESKECWWVPITFFVPSKPDNQDTHPNNWLSCQMEKLVLDTGADNDNYIIFNNKFAGTSGIILVFYL